MLQHPNKIGGWAKAATASRPGIKFDSDGQFDDAYFQQTEESNGFRQEYEMRKMKQDQGLDMIAEGLDTLKNMAHDMNEELDRQVPLMDEIDTKVDRASSDLKNTNVRLRDTVNQSPCCSCFPPPPSCNYPHLDFCTLVVALVMVMMKLEAVGLFTRLLLKLLGPSQLLFVHMSHCVSCKQFVTEEHSFPSA